MLYNEFASRFAHSKKKNLFKAVVYLLGTSKNYQLCLNDIVYFTEFQLRVFMIRLRRSLLTLYATFDLSPVDAFVSTI